MNPSVAVIIPTYNRAHCLPRALASVLAQEYKDFEIIIVDDGSTDGTSQLSCLTAPQTAVRVITLPLNRGVANARNCGVAASCAPWIAFLDSDDQWHAQKLKKQMAWVAANPSAHIVQTKEIWNRSGKRVNPPATHEKFGGDLFSASLDRCMITPSSVLMTRELFTVAGPFNESFPACEDYDLWLKITCCYPVGLVGEYLLTRYGGHDDQLSATVPLLDRFRIRSMQDLLDSKRLNEHQVQLTRIALVKRARIMAAGYLKRGKQEEYEYYERIIEQHG